MPQAVFGTSSRRYATIEHSLNSAGSSRPPRYSRGDRADSDLSGLSPSEADPSSLLRSALLAIWAGHEPHAWLSTMPSLSGWLVAAGCFTAIYGTGTVIDSASVFFSRGSDPATIHVLIRGLPPVCRSRPTVHPSPRAKDTRFTYQPYMTKQSSPVRC